MRIFLEPTEPLLFRTGRSFDAGESGFAETLFPPTPETLQGAIRAAIATLKQQKPARIVVAVPVTELTRGEEIAAEVDEFICPLRPVDFSSVGSWYTDFSQTTDEEVYELLQKTGPI